MPVIIKHVAFSLKNGEDEYGLDPALKLKEAENYESILLFPLTMISKRIEDDIEVNIEELFWGICNKINEMVSEN